MVGLRPASSAVERLVRVLATEMAVRHPDAFDSWALAAPALAGMPHNSSWPKAILANFSFRRSAATGAPATNACALDRSGLVVRRFDRVKVGRTERSLAVEDGCQALGLHPEAKYRITTEELLGKLCALCEAPVPAARVFLAQVVFAYLTATATRITGM